MLAIKGEFMKKFLMTITALLLMVNISIGEIKPLGTVVTYNKGGHTWDQTRIRSERRIHKKWVTVDDYRINEFGCEERWFQLFQECWEDGELKYELIREVILDIQC